jgi:hypothetical protein
MQNGRYPQTHPPVAPTAVTTRSRSAAVRLEPGGRQRPSRKRDSGNGLLFSTLYN